MNNVCEGCPIGQQYAKEAEDLNALHDQKRQRLVTRAQRIMSEMERWVDTDCEQNIARQSPDFHQQINDALKQGLGEIIADDAYSYAATCSGKPFGRRCGAKIEKVDAEQ